ncbi:50S ribosomal protein L24 [Candidatus Peregrinibacteria bacterium CG11_big_fil_rev_8_21_14_0_20_41_10]|nr:MAG: 50S ribosomal protein L24 [Candidatus Peregrinibacteria bacterium CG11_big_fil_rev_8_21_14_0_20_41_10]PIZ76769.1 MAG: 50S ribosomal protein L24 [Candidatus Peregrinibacteria bacterium CG_4_10_14_0_2_um_filter_41_8]PJC37972.1 MAG: 50S ribosomal protein L24 [Candidatus Peregrinibacteria bacterium CG_4_9_14_0_2_um_filter_41_14]
MKIKTGDQVIVISGANKGKQGKVMRVIKTADRIVVEKVNVRKRHVRRGPNQPGQIVEFEASIHVSNVSIIDPKTSKPTRIGYQKLENGKKIRIAKKSGQELK